MMNLGDFTTSETIYVPFCTYDSSGASVTITGLAVTDIEIYKDGSVTQRASDSGYALLDTDGIDFDTTTGLHGFSVDLSDNTDAGFYANGSQYWLVVNAITVDGQTVVFCYYFTIGRYLKPTTAGRTLDVTATGAAGIDWANVENPTTAVDLSATDIRLCDTVTTNTDMRGTDSAALASVCTEARLAELDAANLPADVDTLLTRITAALFSGITSLAQWLGLIAGKQAGNATALTEIKATGAGAGTFDPTTDSIEALRDRGDSAWITATSVTVSDKTGFSLASTGLDLVLIDGKALPVALQHVAAGVAGKVAGAGTGTELFYGLDGSTLRMTVTVDADGNRTAITYNDV